MVWEAKIFGNIAKNPFKLSNDKKKKRRKAQNIAGVVYLVELTLPKNLFV